jgi:SecD/SecF fusion protein
MTDRQRNGFILLLVAGLVAASLAVILTQKTVLGLDLKGGVELVYQGEPSAQVPKVTPAALTTAVDIMRTRIDQLGVTGPSIQTSGNNQITVGLPSISDLQRAQKQVGTTAQLYFYDWEANALVTSGPNAGKPVASQLQTQDPTAVLISQGNLNGSLAPGSPNAGSIALYPAVQLAHKQPTAPLSTSQSHRGPVYYLFGAPGSTACSVAAQAQHTTPIVGTHCLLAGPESNPTYISQDLSAKFGTKLNVSQGQMLTVPQGTVVVQAVDASQSKTTPVNSPLAQFYVLKDNFGLQGTDITNPQASTDQAGNPDVQFSFTSKGQSEFSSVTNQIAKRGFLSPPGQTYNQHFAVALDGKLITVPSIDYHQYPDGISGGNGADITGGFTSTSAQDLATLLQDGALPINLRLISSSQVSATLGSQALHQGLIAGLAGLVVIIIFLLVFYRVLGLIATGALFVYAIYFYALLKLIPVTLTLPGIAGLILTIGVAADANIVIFERVKEEVRAGRSVRAGIVEGYRKGLTAIIDANVVTLLTAFILFVLATSDVQGFAFTLGVGTMVSLFTAVMATQAILMTMGNSRAVGTPAAIGAAKPKRTWRFDFMGASKYFFSMSGVILLIGALAIGGKGLNLGIDFTSGTRITVSLDRPASQKQVQAVMSSLGASDAQVQQVSNKSLGQYVFQISTKQLPQSKVGQVGTKLNSTFGLRGAPNSTSVGPTFGKTVANGAIKAIIASLLVISAYIALRFEWKFSVPVLIALMHDLLITAGVYALTGREVSADTVAALLTILGYSMYDTIIVFDRVRENIPRMPRAAFSQIVNRSMSEVLTRSIATTFCTLMPVVALLLFGGNQVLQNFAFALLIGVASGAYSSIFIASPVLTHWKEREHGFINRRRRIERELGFVPPYADSRQDIDPTPKTARRAGRLTTPEAETVSAAEFEQMKRDLELEEGRGRSTSTLTKRLSHTPGADGPARRAKPKQRAKPAQGGADGPQARTNGPEPGTNAPPRGSEPESAKPSRTAARRAAAAARSKPPVPDGAQSEPDGARSEPVAPGGAPGAPEAPDSARSETAAPDAERPAPAPDIAENDGVAPVPKGKPPQRKPGARNRRHGRPR